AGARVQAAVMLDVRRAVPRAFGRHQEVGLADPAPRRIRWQPAAHDHRRPGSHRGSRRRRPLAGVRTGHHASTWVVRQASPDYRGLDPPASGEPALKHRGYRQWVAWPEQIPLRPDRALLGHVAALQGYPRDVVAGDHGTIVTRGYVSHPGPTWPGGTRAARRPRCPPRPAAATGSSPCPSGARGGGH